jgi:biotin carboxyl carrier protein
VELGGERFEVDLERGPEGLVASVAGRRMALAAAPLGDGGFLLLLDGRSVEVGVRQAGDLMDLWIEGERCHASVEDERERVAQRVDAARPERGRVLKASMPGIVVAVSVAPGAAVTKGQSLVVIEAMKMQNSMQAEADGVVTKVHVASGATVVAGQALVDLGPAT